MGGGLVTKLCSTLATPRTVGCQAPLSMGFSRQEYWNGLHFLLQGIFLTQEVNLGLLYCRQIFIYAKLQKPYDIKVLKSLTTES